jgi:hypothetical protein
MTRLEIKGDDLRKLTKDLRKHADGKRLAKELRTELRKTAKPFVPAVRRAIATLPSKGENARRGRVTLRKRLQKATALRVTTGGRAAGVSIIVSGKKMPDRQGSLPSYVEGTNRRRQWRHPLFGDAERWYAQSAHPFFFKAVRPAEEEAARAAQSVVERIAREVENG